MAAVAIPDDNLIADLRRLIEKRNAELSAALRERDKLRDRNEEVEKTLVLYERTGRYLPVVGITCDRCTNAIGVVGVRVVDADALLGPMDAIASNVGWRKHTTDIKTARALHVCPSCDKELKEVHSV